MQEINLLSFLQETIRLKRIVRSGWVYSGVPLSEVESVADHSQFVTMITMLICFDEKAKGKKINLEKALIMAHIHDLSESVSQDINRCIRKFSPEKFDAFKHDLDKNAANSLFEKLPEEQGKILQDYFAEFQAKKSIEARIVSEADRLETILQMNNYIQKGLSKEMFSDFFTSFNKEVNNYEFDLVKKLAKELLEGE
ncbi:MAG: HD domain-containing protein [Candidatus Heimdallarchaeota archaeon]